MSVILLGRLAISVRAQDLGLGRDLVADAPRSARIGAGVLGARALVAEAIDEPPSSSTPTSGSGKSSTRHDLFAIRLTP